MQAWVANFNPPILYDALYSHGPNIYIFQHPLPNILTTIISGYTI